MQAMAVARKASSAAKDTQASVSIAPFALNPNDDMQITSNAHPHMLDRAHAQLEALEHEMASLRESIAEKTKQLSSDESQHDGVRLSQLR